MKYLRSAAKYNIATLNQMPCVRALIMQIPLDFQSTKEAFFFVVLYSHPCVDKDDLELPILLLPSLQC